MYTRRWSILEISRKAKLEKYPCICTKENDFSGGCFGIFTGLKLLGCQKGEKCGFTNDATGNFGNSFVLIIVAEKKFFIKEREV